MPHYKLTVAIPAERWDELRRIMDMDEIDFDKETDIPYDMNVETITATFDNGNSIEWGMYTGQHNAWAEAWLVVPGIGVVDDDGDVMFSIDGALIGYGGDTYELRIERGE